MIFDSLRKTKDFDTIKSGRVGQKVKSFAKIPAQTGKMVTVILATPVNSVQHMGRCVDMRESKLL